MTRYRDVPSPHPIGIEGQPGVGENVRLSVSLGILAQGFLSFNFGYTFFSRSPGFPRFLEIFLGAPIFNGTHYKIGLDLELPNWFPVIDPYRHSHYKSLAYLN